MRVAANYSNIQILSDELTAQEAEDFCHYAVNEREKVEAFWGATWKEPIRIHVQFMIKMAVEYLIAYCIKSIYLI